MFWKRKKKDKIKEYVYPCSSDDCLVRMANCKQACDKIERNDNKLLYLFNELGRCPDCGSTKFIEGPCGGMAQNVKCKKCGHWFNFGFPLFVHRIHMGKNGEFLR